MRAFVAANTVHSSASSHTEAVSAGFLSYMCMPACVMRIGRSIFSLRHMHSGCAYVYPILISFVYGLLQYVGLCISSCDEARVRRGVRAQLMC